jgi:shikimate kinase
MIQKFVLIGLPGVGKSTTMTECQKILQAQGHLCTVKVTDDIIKKRFTADDSVMLEFQQQKSLKISDEIFKAQNPIGAFMQTFGEEPLWRDLEAMFVADIMAQAKSDEWFDLGGKAPLRQVVGESLYKERIVPIFLYAEHETVVQQLAANDTWKKRSNYYNAGVNGWQDLAKQHREERLAKYCERAVIIIAVDADADKNGKSIVVAKQPAELAKEIFYRVKALEISCLRRYNLFTIKCQSFFADKVQGIDDGKEKAGLNRNITDIKKQKSDFIIKPKLSI